MDAVAFATYMYKILKEREQDIANALAHDTAKDWEQYKLMVGEVRGIAYAREEIKALLERSVDDGEDIIRS